MLPAAKRALPFIGILLISGGLILSGLFGWSFLNQGPPLYSYELVAEGGTEDFPDLGLKDAPDIRIRKYEVHTPGVSGPLAVLHLGQRSSEAPVLLGWRNNTTEPVLRIWPPVADTQELSREISKHIPDGSVVLGSWGTLRQLKLLDQARVLFDENLDRPVIIPSVWAAEGAAIAEIEREFWHVGAAPESAPGFEAYVDALLMDEAAGVAALRELTGGKQAYVVVHVYDAYMFGAMHPDRIAIGYTDFAGSGKIHGTAKRVRTWIGENELEDYTVTNVPGSDSTRAFFLSDTESRDTLIVRMLPFTSSNPFGLEGLRVVYQRGGYWVFKLLPEGSQS